MFELSQLRCFVTLATELNFRRAAERLHMTQPPLSRQIQLLEHQLGIPLFIRSTRSVALTAAGRTFFIEATTLLEQAHRAAQAAQRTARGECGAVAISFVASAVYEFLPQAISQSKKQHPDVQITLHEMNSFEQIQALRTQRVDLAIVRAPQQLAGLGTEHLASEPFVLAVPKEHPLATRQPLTLQALQNQPFIGYAHTDWQPFSELLTGMFRANGITPDYVQSLGSTLTILALVNAGMGVALVPQSASTVRFEHVVFRQLPLPPGIHSDLHLMWQQESDNPALQTVLEAVRHAAKSRRQGIIDSQPGAPSI